MQQLSLDDDQMTLRSILDSAPSAIVSINEDGVIIEWNRRAEEMFGWLRIEVMGKVMEDVIIPHRLRSAHRAGFARHLKTNKNVRIGQPLRLSALTKVGDEIPIELFVTKSERNGRRIFTSYISDLKDIVVMENRVRVAEDEILQYKKKALEADSTIAALNSIITEAGMLVCTKDIDGRFLSMNDAALELTGVPVEAFIGKSVNDMTFNKQVADQANEADRLCVSGQVVTTEEVMKHGDQVGKTLLVTRTPYRDHAGKIIGIYCLANDITDYKKSLLQLSQIENERLHANEKLALDASKAKTQFLSHTSHELRTPINGILGFTSLLFDTVLTPEQHELLSGIMSASQILMSIINDILDIAKIEAGKIELEDVDVDLQGMLDDQRVLFSHLAQEKQITLDVQKELPGDVRWIRADLSRLRQIFTNLLSNAIKFTDVGGQVSLKVHDVKDGMISFSVHDNGVGVQEEKKSLLFQAFQQAESDITRRYGGTGLGLSICKNLAQLMGGDISFDSVYGKGSTFKFSIKYRQGQSNVNVSSTSDAGSQSSMTSSKFILVVDDNAMNLKVCRRMVEFAGYKVDTCQNGREAVETLKKSPDKYGVVLLDCQMPIMDGYTATKLIRSCEPPLSQIPIVAMTANALKGEKENCIEQGFSDYITKPINRSLLIERIQHWLNAKK